MAGFRTGKIESFSVISPPEPSQSASSLSIRFSLRTLTKLYQLQGVEVRLFGVMFFSRMSRVLQIHSSRRNSSRPLSWVNTSFVLSSLSMDMWWSAMHSAAFSSTTRSWRFSFGVPQTTQSIPSSQSRSIWSGSLKKMRWESPKVSPSETFLSVGRMQFEVYMWNDKFNCRPQKPEATSSLSTFHKWNLTEFSSSLMIASLRLTCVHRNVA